MDQLNQAGHDTADTTARPPVGPWVIESAAYGGAVLTPAGMLMLARVWHDQGAAHSTGDMLGAFGLAAALAGAGLAVPGDSATTTSLVIAAAGLATTGAAAYANEIAYPGILAGLATLVGVLAVHRGRDGRRERREQRRHERDLARVQAAATVAAAQVAADDGARYRQALADAYAHRARLDTGGPLDPSAVLGVGSVDVDAEFAALVRDQRGQER